MNNDDIINKKYKKTMHAALWIFIVSLFILLLGLIQSDSARANYDNYEITKSWALSGAYILTTLASIGVILSGTIALVGRIAYMLRKGHRTAVYSIIVIILSIVFVVILLKIK